MFNLDREAAITKEFWLGDQITKLVKIVAE